VQLDGREPDRFESPLLVLGHSEALVNSLNQYWMGKCLVDSSLSDLLLDNVTGSVDSSERIQDGRESDKFESLVIRRIPLQRSIWPLYASGRHQTPNLPSEHLP
jgi:hypothetical protein